MLPLAFAFSRGFHFRSQGRLLVYAQPPPSFDPASCIFPSGSRLLPQGAVVALPEKSKTRNPVFTMNVNVVVRTRAICRPRPCYRGGTLWQSSIGASSSRHLTVLRPTISANDLSPDF